MVFGPSFDSEWRIKHASVWADVHFGQVRSDDLLNAGRLHSKPVAFNARVKSTQMPTVL